MTMGQVQYLPQFVSAKKENSSILGDWQADTRKGLPMALDRV